MNRRDALIALALTPFSTAGWTASYPNRLVRIIMPFPAGGPADQLIRLIAEEFQRSLKQPFIVDNRPGATGAIGTTAVQNEPADGHTLLFTSNSAHVIAPLLQQKTGKLPVEAFVPILPLVRYPFYLVASKQTGASSVADLVAYAKRKGGGNVNFGSVGVGSGNHIVGEQFRRLAGIDATHVPYKGMSAAQTALIRGEVDFMFDSIGSAQPYVDAKSITGLAVSSRQRSRFLPDTPTLEESGISGIDATIWLALFVRRETPTAIIADLRRVAKETLKVGRLAPAIEGFSYDPITTDADTFGSAVASEEQFWRDTIAAAKITIEN